MKRLVLAAGILAALSLSGAGAQTGRIVTNYAQDMSFLPANIAAIHFALTNLDPHHTITWGDWTVQFGSASPVATPFTAGGKTDSFEIPLQCNNPVAGTKDCEMEIVETKWEVPYCRIRDGERIDFAIDCPKSLELAP